MKSYTKQILRDRLKTENEILRRLRVAYTQAAKDIENKVERLIAREKLGSGNVLQLRYQKRLRAVINEVLKGFDEGLITTLEDYLKTAYIDGQIGALYSLQRQGIPLLLPVHPDKVALSLPTGPYAINKTIGRVIVNIADTVQQEITRGLVQGSSFSDIAKGIEARCNVGLSRSYTIARTEAHRVTEEARYDTMKEAETYGVKMYKRWDAALDSRTRITHMKLDGVIVPIDQPFVVDGKKAMYPGAFGEPEEDINCRCTIEEVAQWEINENLARTKYSDRDGMIVNVGDIKDYEKFKRKYKSTL